MARSIVEEVLVDVVNTFVEGGDLTQYPQAELLVVAWKIGETEDAELLDLRKAISEAYPNAQQQPIRD